MHERLAAALFERGDLRNAERHLQAAQKLGATPETEHNLAVLAWQQGKRKRQLQQWTALVSKVPEARFNLGVALEAAGRHREAYEAFDRFAKTGGGPNAAKAGEIAEAKRRIFGFAEAP
ncbi:MAG: tetratricopeptide repeat protein [Myxococcales bacterium]|nr:tetratricopeptide repeat protein [Myxococcales bacterium]